MHLNIKILKTVLLILLLLSENFMWNEYFFDYSTRMASVLERGAALQISSFQCWIVSSDRVEELPDCLAHLIEIIQYAS